MIPGPSLASFGKEGREYLGHSLSLPNLHFSSSVPGLGIGGGGSDRSTCRSGFAEQTLFFKKLILQANCFKQLLFCSALFRATKNIGDFSSLDSFVGWLFFGWWLCVCALASKGRGEEGEGCEWYLLPPSASTSFPWMLDGGLRRRGKPQTHFPGGEPRTKCRRPFLIFSSFFGKGNQATCFPTNFTPNYYSTFFRTFQEAETFLPQSIFSVFRPLSSVKAHKEPHTFSSSPLPPILRGMRSI